MSFKLINQSILICNLKLILTQQLLEDDILNGNIENELSKRDKFQLTPKWFISSPEKINISFNLYQSQIDTIISKKIGNIA